MPMSENNIVKNSELLKVLYEQLSHLDDLLTILIAEENAQLDGGRRYTAISRELVDINNVQKELLNFLRFLSSITQYPLNERNNLIEVATSDETYAQHYDRYLAESHESNSSFPDLLSAQKIFDLYKNKCKHNSFHLNLALNRFEEPYPRITLDYITDTIRAVLYYVDRFITFMTCQKQTMRETTTPGASFFGKKHFIEPSTPIAVKEKLAEIFFSGESSLTRKLQTIGS